MLIAIDVRSLLEGRHSGVEEYTKQIITNLVKNAPWHHYVFFYNSFTLRHPDFLSGLGQVVAYHFPHKIFILCQYLFAYPRWDKLILRVIGRQPDLFFLPNAGILPAGPTPIVVTAHDLAYNIFPEFYSLRHRLWHQLMKPRCLLRSAQHVIAVSAATKHDLIRQYHLQAEKISVVYSGVKADKTPSRFHPAKINYDQRLVAYHLPTRYILFLGTIEPRKNITSLIEAFTSLAPDISQDLVIAGENGWLTRRIDKAIKQSNQAKRIYRLGFVAEKDKTELYRRADLFVYPSFYEGFGFPPLEALLAGTPVITACNSSLPEIVGAWAVMINPYDVTELAQVMREMLISPRTVHQSTKTAILRQYSWDQAARQTLKIFSQALRRQK